MKVQILLGLLALGVPNAQPSVRSPVPAAGVVYTPPFTGAVQRPQSSKNADTVSVKDFGAVGDGVTDDTAAVQAAIAAAQAANADLVFPGTGNYLTTIVGVGTVAAGTHWIGAGTVSGNGGRLGVFQRIQPIAPAPQAPANYPLGNDLWLIAQGTADLHIQTWSFNLTSTTTVAAPGSTTITVGTPKVCPGTATGNANCASTAGTATASLCLPAAGCALIIDQDTAQEETITSANWSIASGTTITATFANTHTQPYNVRQIGTVSIDARSIDFSGGPTKFTDTNGVPFLTLPANTAGTFPTSAIKVRGLLTGDPTDLQYRNATTGSCFKWINNANSGFLAQMCETSASGQMFLGNATNNSLTLLGKSDIGRIYGGGTALGLQFFSVTGGNTGKGTFNFKDNDTGSLDTLKIDTNTRTVTAQNLLVVTGVGADGGGFKHKRVSGCATAASLAATCTTTVTWGTTFADANYTATCTGDLVTSGVPLNGGLTAKIAASITFQTVSATAAAAQYTTIDCVAVHD